MGIQRVIAVADESALNHGPEVLVRVEGTSESPFPCILLRASQGKIHLRTNQWIEPATRVTAAFPHISVAGAVVYCTRIDTGYRFCISMISGNDKRREPRLLTRQPGKIVALSADGSESTSGTLVDLSVSGMRLEMTHRVETGTMIFFVTGSIAIVGEVRYSHQRQLGGFEAGVEIIETLYDPEVRETSVRSILKGTSLETRLDGTGSQD